MNRDQFGRFRAGDRFEYWACRCFDRSSGVSGACICSNDDLLVMQGVHDKLAVVEKVGTVATNDGGDRGCATVVDLGGIVEVESVNGRV